MQAEIQNKAKQFIDKNAELLAQKKYYELAQKIKLLGHRKFQSKKLSEAEIIFKAGASVLYSIPEVEKHVPLELIEQLVDIYSMHPELLTPNSENDILKLLQKRPVTFHEAGIIHKLIERTGEPSRHPTISQFYIDFNVQRQRFAQVEVMAACLSYETSWSLVEKWEFLSGIQKSEVPALWCRMVLWRGVIHGLKDAQQIFGKIKQIHSHNDPYTLFTGFLLKSAMIKSREAYDAIERAYASFLASDNVFLTLYNKFGSKYFGIEKGKAGLMSLIQ